MAHKARPKSKLVLIQQAKPNPKIKATQNQTKTNEKTTTTTTTTTTENGNTNVPSCSFMEPIVRVVNPSLAEKGSGPRQKTQPDEIETTKAPVVIFYKRGNMKADTDIIGAKALTIWKKSSGRSKSWVNCRRKKISQSDLELLVESQVRSVAFGWRIYSTVTPSSFLRSQGLSANSGLTRKRSSTTRTSGNLAAEDDRRVPIPRGRPVWGWANRQGNEHRAEWGFLRLTINREIASLTREAYITTIKLPTSDEVSERDTTLYAEETRGLPVLRLLRNDSHADVYLVYSPDAPFEFYHAHAFLSNGLSGNWPTFAKRKMKHLRGSRGFVFEILQGARTIIVMEPESKAEDFRLKLTQNEFPPLPGIDPNSAKTRLKKNIGRLSYAEVVGRERPSKHCLDSNHRAYKAWEDRKGRGKKKATIKLDPPSRISKVSQLESKAEDFADWVTVNRRRLRPIAYRSQGSNL